ncbi:MAG TPA: IS1634 family transposase [Thiotrichaceae bacterium]|nr:IS1634 family transposase [Thiotrichaceae bacterium]
MFVRKKRNNSGVISIQVITKLNGKSKLVKTIGSSIDNDELEELVAQGQRFIDNCFGQQTFDFSSTVGILKSAFESITSHTEIGTDLLLGKIFDDIGFNELPGNLFKNLVIARLYHPVSKLKTSDYLFQNKNIDIPVQKIYRYLDKLYSEQKELIQQISYDHTLKILNDEISVVFYDVTTLYFQIDNEDEIRIRGFSKEGKHQNPQIVLGLLVSIDGYPLAFDIFEGNKFEGHTMLPVLDAFKEKYKLDKLIIVADSGLLSNHNIVDLQQKGYEFILGARIKNEPKKLKEKILALELKNGESKIIKREDGLKLIISYSDKRAKKDKHNRDRGLQRLEKQVKSGKLTKSNINNRGYNKYLKMDGDIKISIDKTKYEADSKWDGLKGYITNTSLNKGEIIENYGHLWKIEKAFRISKHDLKVRPIYHRLQRRIEAHITINFVAYKIYKELERQLKEKQSDLSPEKAIDIAKTIYQIEAKSDSESIKHLLLLTDKQKLLAELFDFG